MTGDQQDFQGTPSERSTRPAGLTAREVQVLHYLCLGFRNREIAADAGMAPRTVEAHVRSILKKLGVRTRTEAVIKTLGGR